ncbi:MAG: hypothetical protein OXH65_09425 [Paracoccaceae bacterium]|nr:hypothetical protein [Paracoccaceae bacterium]MDE2675313.1 hypothetical protein [Paracoccaceae bacterium]
MIENKKLLDDFAILISDYWRLLRMYKRLVAESKLENQSRLNSHFRNAERRLNQTLDEHKIKLISYEGKPYSPNLAVTVVNHDEFDDNENLLIHQMLEPTIIVGESYHSIGKAILSKKKDI